MDIEGMMAIFGIFFLPIIMVILIVWFKINSKNKQNKLKADLIAKAIENGQTIPDNLFEKKEKKSPLQNGITWTTIGVGIALFFVFVSIAKNDYKQLLQGVGIAMIPVFIGIGCLVTHFISKKQTKENDSEK